MSGCCDRDGYDEIFGDRFARRVARRCRKRGLDPTRRRVVDFLVSHGIEDATILEIGGGIGELHLELLRRGARAATNLEISNGYEQEASMLLDESGLGDQVTRRFLDIATSPDEVEPADVVVLHRVVCCYPDYNRLLSAAASHAGQFLVFSHPPRTLLTRSSFGFEIWYAGFDATISGSSSTRLRLWWPPWSRRAWFSSIGTLASGGPS